MNDDEVTGSEAQGDDSQTAGGTEQAGSQAGPWEDVTRALQDLGDAVTAWAAALKDDPDTQRHARQLKDGFERLGRQIGDTLDSAADSDLGKSVAQAAGRAGAAVSDAARKAADQVGPFAVTALRGAAEGIRRAADGLEKRAGTGPTGDEVAAETTPPAPEPPAAPEPPEVRPPDE